MPNYQNSEIKYKSDLKTFVKILHAYLTAKRQSPAPMTPIPIRPIEKQQITQDTNTFYRLGHSSLLLNLAGKIILIDPVFSDRASPFSWMGPKRFHPVPLNLSDFSDIDVLLISHDHYDHLDKSTIIALQEKVKCFFLPEKVDDRLIKWGIPKEKITRFDWWESQQIEDIVFTFVPAQHFSGRSALDKDSTLWGGWIIKNAAYNLFFSGDSGYFSEFKTIGEKYGPFDVTFIETGAYNTLWSEIHMFPSESIQAHLDLNGKVMVPIHNSTFDLSLHDWFEPMNQAFDLAMDTNIAISFPTIGQGVPLSHPQIAQKWWVETEKKATKK